MTTRKRLLACALLSCFWALPLLAVLTAGTADAAEGDAEALQLLRVTPDGSGVSVFRTEQIAFQFSQPIAPIGRMERDAAEVPISITPAVDCQWRWLDPTVLSCQLQGRLRNATAYEIEVRPGDGLTAESGATLPAPIQRSFTTTAPEASYSNVWNRLAPGKPIIRVSFNQPVSKTSVEETLFFSRSDEDGDPTGAPVSVLVYPEYHRQRLPVWYEGSDEQYIPPIAEPIILPDGDEARRGWVIEPVEALPADSFITLSHREGLQSVGGDVPGDAEVIDRFYTFPSPEFAGLYCLPYGEVDRVFVPVAELAADSEQIPQGCEPYQPVRLAFTAPVLDFAVRDNARFTPPLDEGRNEDYDPWRNHRNQSDRDAEHERGDLYTVSLPRPLQPSETYRVEFGDELTDEFDRSISTGPREFVFSTSDRSPSISARYQNAVIEKDLADSDVPLRSVNIDEIDIAYERLTTDGVETDLRINRPMPDAHNLSIRSPLGMQEMLEGESGMVAAYVYPQPKPPGMENDSIGVLAQVTPYQVHYKVGHFNSLVWVTDFATGNPVQGATVTMHKGYHWDLANLEALDDVTASTDRQGIAELPGLAQLDPQLDLIFSRRQGNQSGLSLRVEKGDDMAVVPLSYHYRVYHYGPSFPSIEERGHHSHAWGATAQGIYRLGDTVDFKIYLRAQSNRHWVPADYSGLVLRVQDPQNKVIYENDAVELNDFGAFDGSFRLPRQGTVGRYRFILSAPEHAPPLAWVPMTVLVSDFTPAPFSVSNGLNGGAFHPGDEVQVTSNATMYAGGPYSNAELRVTARLESTRFTVDDPALQGFTFSHQDAPVLRYNSRGLLDVRGQLNMQGEHEETFTLLDREIYYGRLQVESAVRDERGALISNSTQADYVGRSLYAGLRRTAWLYEAGEESTIEAIAVDEAGQPISGQNITVSVLRRQTRSARVRGAGNAYRTQNTSEWEEQSICELVSSSEPVLCEFVPPQPGSYRFVATVTDSEGREHRAALRGWAIGSGIVVWDQGDRDLSIIPEQTEYNIGDTARFLVQNPYPGARALVTVERYGVLASWVETLQTGTPVIEVPIEPDYLPGFYLSVVVMSPRVEAPLENGVDLGKPTYRMGYIRARVSDPYKELAVEVETDEEEYRPRQLVRADFRVRPGRGRGRGPYEIAVAVVDESVLALNRDGDSYYDPYEGFNRLDRLDVLNYSLLTRLVGRQVFDSKGANPGGGGGNFIDDDISKALDYDAGANPGGGGGNFIDLRNLFKYVSYWNPSLVTDSRGRAQAQFTLPDNLTGWRVLAMAVTPEDRMGLGSGSFRVNRETEIRPVMPNQLSVGDSFKAGFSIMNRTAETRELDVEIQVQGSRDLLPGSAREQALQQQCEDAAAQPEHDAVFPCEASAHRQQVTLLPYQRENVWLDVGTLSAGDIEFVAVAGDEQDRDALSHSVPVNRRISLTHAVSHGIIADDLSRSTTAVERINDSDARAEESVLFPEDIHSDAGGLNVILSPSILGNIDGSLRYMKEYPYGCWEQRTSKALAAAAYLQLTAYLPDSVEWEDADEYVQRMLEEAVDFQAANGGMAYWVPNERNVSPYLSAYTAFAFARLRTAGYEVPAGVERALHEYLQELLRQDEFPDYYSRGMVASVRAAALAALADSGALSEQDIARYAPQVENMSLFAKTNFLRAAVKTAGSGHDTVSDTLRQIMNHASRSSGRVQFTETRDDGYKRLLSSSARSECGALSAMLAAQDAENAADIIGDTPLTLARQVMQDRSNRGHWGNTQENVYCLNAIVDYARAYEATEPDMAVEVSFIPKPSESQASAKESIDEVMGRVSFSERSSSPVILQRPMSEGDPGLAASVHIDKSGDGTLYYANRLGYQPLEASATRVDAGIDIRREYSVERGGEFVILQSPMQIRRGELVKVDLFVSVAAARYFVVVDDPVPGGLEPLNTDLATASETDAAKAAAEPTEGSWFHQFDDWRTYNASYYRDFYHRELRHDAVRFYSDYLRPGRYHLSYVAQAIAEGEFAVQPSHSEEMYEPDIFGKSMPARLTVAE